jgi:Flp pilus assembly protein TadD
MHNEFGISLHRHGRHKDAEREYREAVHLKPDNPAFHFNLGYTLYEQGRYEEAEEAFREADRLQPDNPICWANRAECNAGLARWDKAKVDYARAFELSRDLRPNFWSGRALVCLARGDTTGYRAVCSDMVKHFGEAADTDPNGQVPFACALGPDAVSDFAGPLRLARKAVGSAPNNAGYLRTLGRLLFRAGRLDEAVTQLNRSCKLEDDARVWFTLALAHHRLGHVEEAREWLDKAVKWMEQPRPRDDRQWSHRLQLDLLRREAEEQIRGPGKTPGGKVPGRHPSAAPQKSDTK